MVQGTYQPWELFTPVICTGHVPKERERQIEKERGGIIIIIMSYAYGYFLCHRLDSVVTQTKQPWIASSEAFNNRGFP